MEAAGVNFINYEFGICTDLPFITCTGYDEPSLIYAVALAFGIDLLATTPLTTPVAALPFSSLILILGCSFYVIVFKKKRK